VTRTLEWDGCLNVRDLGGVPLEHGGHTRYGALVRADNVRRLTDEGWRALDEHGVVRIVDLRWPEELDEDPPRDVAADVVHVSLLGELDVDYRDDIATYMAAGDPAGYWTSSYTGILDEFKANFGRALAAIADAPDGVVVFHCAGGKDRTGLISALLLRLAGVSIDDIAADYALSEANLNAGPRTWIESAPDETVRRQREFMQQTPPDAMVRTLEQLEQRWGGVREYLQAAGLSSAELDRLEARLAAA
jgi:protein tyrosine/serine phosphatase